MAERPVDQTSDHVRGCYDAVARAYADRFDGELEHKPLDRDVLARFADEVRGLGPVWDLGCGPGGTTAFLHDLGVAVRGLDLSPGLVGEAARQHPAIEFETGDMMAVPGPDETLGGVVAFYAIVHFSPAELPRALAEMHRVLRPGGRLLLAFHIGEETVRVDDFLGGSAPLDFVFHRPEVVAAGLAEAGFEAIEVVEREPYPDVEYPSRRAYLFARKPGRGAPSSGVVG